MCKPLTSDLKHVAEGVNENVRVHRKWWKGNGSKEGSKRCQEGKKEAKELLKGTK